MGTIELRKKWIKSIAKVDERFLRMVDALYDSYAKESVDSHIPDEHKKILDSRLESYKKNPNDVLDWEDARRDW